MKKNSIRHLAAAAFTVTALSGCAGTNLGALGDILGGAMGGPGQQGQQGQVVVEVQGVDARQQVIAVRTQQGQQGNVMYDQNTIVVYQNQQYPVTALERGDVVSMQVQQTQRGQPYASRIDVQQSVQERTGQAGSVGGTGAAGQLQQMAGRVGQIDHNRGTFQLQTQQGTFVVSLPYNPGNATTDYFHRLRTGQTVRLEGTFMGNGRVELYRFI
ncbi:MAG: hypothetical protein KY467_02525 [Gemmatimonadetes bacterium]|nr:hypothetical protein [Gemmatimonadota bacterium]